MTTKKEIFAVGRRKTAIARVKIQSGEGQIVINDRELNVYFPTITLQNTLNASQELVKADKKFDLFIRVRGGGINGQAEACRMGIARALQFFNTSYRPALKKAGYLRRDSRMVERKKYGFRKARRGTQFSKR